MNNKRQIVNIINFIRACEPRHEMDLLEPVAEQIKLMKKHNLRGTFLLQYDALIRPEYTALLKTLDPEQFEIGVWFEIVEPLVNKAGIPWTGRFPWDWHVHCGFAQGYTKSQRETLINILYEEFRSVFGYYPRVFGSWIFDSHTARYISDTYGADAFCNCKEQYGTDGYTLWGGYYGQGYYPSRTNIFMPAQTEKEQLPVPVFRMLGSDPVYQYDFGDIENAAGHQAVITLEPVYHEAGGGVPEWIDWYLKENYNGECLSFGYAQAGQENSFGWESMKDGLIYQFAEFERLQKEGRITVEPLGETGRWFKSEYKQTPASAITAHSAWDDPEKRSVWYCSRFYRTNLYADNDTMRIRDLHLFDEQYPDPFEDTVCTANEACYDTLPLADGHLHTANGIPGGLHFRRPDGSTLPCSDMKFTDLENGQAKVDFGTVSILLSEDRMEITAAEDFILENRIVSGVVHTPSILAQSDSRLDLSYNGTKYSVRLESGRFESATAILSENGRITAVFA